MRSMEQRWGSRRGGGKERAESERPGLERRERERERERERDHRIDIRLWQSWSRRVNYAAASLMFILVCGQSLFY